MDLPGDEIVEISVDDLIDVVQAAWLYLAFCRGSLPGGEEQEQSIIKWNRWREHNRWRGSD